MLLPSFLRYMDRTLIEQSVLKALLVAIGAIAFSTPRQLAIILAGLALLILVFALEEVETKKRDSLVPSTSAISTPNLNSTQGYFQYYAGTGFDEGGQQ